MNRIIRAADALGIRTPKNVRTKLAKLAAVLIALSGLIIPNIASAATLTSASVSLSDSRPSTTGVTYTFTGSSFTSAAIQCIQVVFSTTATGQVNPSGFTGTGGSITTGSSNLFSSWSGWTLVTADGSGASVGAKNVWQYTHTGGVTPNTLTSATFAMAGITNSSTADTGYYLQFSTFNNTNCSSSPVDNANVQFINTSGSQLSLTVNGSLTFTVAGVANSTSCDGGTTTNNSGASATGSTLNYGTVVSGTPYLLCQTVTAATNSTNGFTVYLNYDKAPTNALGQTIALTTGTNASPATFGNSSNSQGVYGYTTDDTALSRFQTAGQQWAAPTTTQEPVEFSSTGVTSKAQNVGHQVQITTTTEPGTYQDTIIYTCTPVY